MNNKVLSKIADGLNKVECNFGIGGSVLLNFHGLVDKPNDIDILINSKDTEKVKEFMNTIGDPIELCSKEPFKTESFFGYNVDGVIVEFMGNFKISLENNKIYEFILDDKAIVDILVIGDSNIKFTSLEDWFVAYLVMGDPKKRVSLIQKYFKENGIKHRYLLQRNLNNNFSKHINEVIEEELLFNKI